MTRGGAGDSQFLIFSDKGGGGVSQFLIFGWQGGEGGSGPPNFGWHNMWTAPNTNCGNFIKLFYMNLDKIRHFLGDKTLPFQTCWTILSRFWQYWTISDYFENVWSFWTILDHFEPLFDHSGIFASSVGFFLANTVIFLKIWWYFGQILWYFFNGCFHLQKPSRTESST